MSKENIVRYSADELRRMAADGKTQADWAKFDALSDDAIDAVRRSDPDFIDIDWSNAVAVYPQPKQALSIRLDQDILDFFKDSGKGYQTRINAVLRHYMQETLKAKKAG